MAKPSYQALFDKALAAGSARRYDEAIELLTRIVAETDAHPEAWLFLGRAFYARGDYERSVPPLASYLGRKPQEASGWFFLGRSYLALGLAREAARSLKKSLELDIGRAEAWTLLGLAELKAKRSGKALKCLEKAMGLAPNEPRIEGAYLNALSVHALRLLARGDADMARQMLSFVIQKGASGPAPLLARARAYRLSGRLEEALADLQAALGHNPDDQAIAMQAAALSFALGKPEAALRYLQDSGAQLPGTSEQWSEDAVERWRAALALQRGDFKEALDAALGRLKKGDKDPGMRAVAAQAYYELGRYDRAANHYKLACDADPASPDLRMGLSLALWESGDARGARAQASAAAARGAPPADSDYVTLLCDAAAGLAPETLLPRVQQLLRARAGDPRLMFILAEAQYKLGMPDLADAWFKNVLKVRPRHELALLYRISAAESLSDSEGALARYREYLAAYPDNGSIRREFASALMAHGHWGEAALVIEGGYAYGIGGAQVTAALAVCYRNAKRYREAAAAYRSLLKDSPKSLEYLLGLAYALERSGARSLAAELLERGAAYIKTEAAPYVALGILREKAKQPEQAAQAYSTAAELAPADPRPLRRLQALYEATGIGSMAATYRERAERLEGTKKRRT